MYTYIYIYIYIYIYFFFFAFRVRDPGFRIRFQGVAGEGIGEA